MHSAACHDIDLQKACKKCLLPEPFAQLNGDRLCQECSHEHPAPLKGDKALARVFEPIRGKYPYDCMVALSGGRDSAYALYIVKNVLKLNCLAFNHDNEMTHPQAIANMENMCRNLNVDLVRIKSRRKLCTSIVADLIRALAQFGPNVLKTALCGPCNVGAYLGAKKLVAEHNIPVIVLGNSKEEKLPDTLRKPVRVRTTSQLFNPQGLFYVRAQINKLRHRLELSSSLTDSMNMRFAPKNDEPERQKLKATSIVTLFSYIQWDRRRIITTIEDELGWQRPEGRTSSWRFDCQLIDFINYLWFKTYGYPKSFFGHVQMIRSGNMDRKEALDQLLEKNWGLLTDHMRTMLSTTLGVEDKYVERVESY